MKFIQEKYHRRSTRIEGYDYSQAGLYFITICTKNRESIFGKIDKNEMILNQYGEIAKREWFTTAKLRQGVHLNAFVIMPNHIHGIIQLTGSHNCRGTARRAPRATHNGNHYQTPGNNAHRAPRTTHNDFHNQFPGNNVPHAPGASTVEKFGQPTRGTIPTIVRSYKSSVSRGINTLRDTLGFPVWQRNYYEHIIRDEKSYSLVLDYIKTNPLKWEEDEYYEQKGNQNLTAVG